VNTETKQRQAVRVARERRRWTQFDLARRVGCSGSQIAKTETGRASPRDWLKEAIARELEIATWEVVTWKIRIPKSETHANERILRFLGATSEQQAAIDRILDGRLPPEKAGRCRRGSNHQRRNGQEELRQPTRSTEVNRRACRRLRNAGADGDKHGRGRGDQLRAYAFHEHGAGARD
jgi:transcriptional regulator with XRE-family HTH domain